MTRAICFKCGERKSGTFSACGSCGATPRTQNQRALSLVLSEYLSSRKELSTLAKAISSGAQPEIATEKLSKAREALKDPQLIIMLGATPTPKADDGARSDRRKASKGTDAASPAVTKETSGHPERQSALQRNPFWILRATTRDDRRSIVALGEARSLELDSDVAQKACSELVNPRQRLAAEISWLPGVAPTKAVRLVQQVLKDPMSVRGQSGISHLAQANLMAAAFELIDGQVGKDSICGFIDELAKRVEKVSSTDVLRDLNEDRAVSGFPAIGSVEIVESVLAERKRYFSETVKTALDRLPTTELIDVMTSVVAKATDSGEHHAPQLIYDVVDRYEVAVQEFLQKEAENVQKVLEATKEQGGNGVRVVSKLIEQLEKITRNWVAVARPIQLSAKSRGTQHEPSYRLAYEIRSLGIDLFNDHGMLPQSQQIVSLLKELFGELPEVSERVEQDESALENIFHNRAQQESRRKEWAAQLAYSAEVGLVFKNTLSIGVDGLSWKDKHFPLDSITRVRWGGVRHSVNGIPTGTTYTIAFGDTRSEASVELRRSEIYSVFIQKLWMGVGIRLLTEMMESLKKGIEIEFGGNLLIRDDGATLVRHAMFGGGGRVVCSWNEIHVWSADGSFVVGMKTDKKVYSSISYIYTPNAHILEEGIRMAFKKPGMRVLSDILNGD